MIELLGKIPKRIATSGRNSKDFFTRKGDLKYIRSLKPWPLEEVLEEKYKFSKYVMLQLLMSIFPSFYPLSLYIYSPNLVCTISIYIYISHHHIITHRQAAEEMASFILPMLHFAPEQRATAAEMLRHRWIRDVPPFLPGDNTTTTSITPSDNNNSSSSNPSGESSRNRRNSNRDSSSRSRSRSPASRSRSRSSENNRENRKQSRGGRESRDNRDDRSSRERDKERSRSRDRIDRRSPS